MKNILPLFNLLLIFLLISPFLSAQQKNSYVAKVGDDIISPEEYRLRYNLMPLISKQRSTDSTKLELLYTLISEKLFAMEAGELDFDEQDRFNDFYQPLKKMLVRDALFNEEVEKKLNITSSEVKKGISRIKHRLKVNIISSPDSLEIIDIHRQAINGASFDSLLQLRPEFADQKEPYTISFGDVEEDFVEDVLYSLEPGNFSSPVRTKDGWFIFYLKEKIRDNEKEDPAKLESRVKKILRDIKLKDAGIAYMEKLLKDFTITPDTSLFRRIAVKIYDKLSATDTSADRGVNDFIYLSEKDIVELKSEFGADTLMMNFINFENDPAKVNDFLNHYYHNEFKTKSAGLNSVAQKLSFDLKIFIENEVLAREGLKKGLDKLPDVQRDLKMWRENYLAKLYRNSLINSVSVSEDEVLEYYNTLYNSNQPVTQVNIIEIQTDDLSMIELILNELRAGKNFKELASQYSGTNVEETGFFPVTQREEIGRIASTMNIGDVYGPLETEGGYTLFQLADKKDEDIILPSAFEDVKETLRMEITGEKVNSILKNRTAELSEKYQTIINQRVLSSLKVVEGYMFTMRNLGFGGRIMAVPYSYPFHEWVNEAKNIKRILP